MNQVHFGILVELYVHLWEYKSTAES